MVYLITGKAGAGKTHYAQTLFKELHKEGIKVKLLDGDTFRKKTGNKDFSNKGRIENLMKAASVAREYEEEGYTVIVAFVAPQAGWRNTMQQFWEKSIVIYIPGGTLWEGTSYQRPQEDELSIVDNRIK